MEVKCNYSIVRASAQYETHCHSLWKPYLRTQRASLIFYGLFLVGTLLSFFIGRQDYLIMRIVMLIILIYVVGKPLLQYQMYLNKIRKYCRSLPLALPDMKIGFDTQSLWLFDGTKRTQWDWSKLKSYTLNANTLKLFWENENLPMIIEPEEVTPEFFWELAAALNRIQPEKP